MEVKTILIGKYVVSSRRSPTKEDPIFKSQTNAKNQQHRLERQTLFIANPIQSSLNTLHRQMSKQMTVAHEPKLKALSANILGREAERNKPQASRPLQELAAQKF